MQEFINSLETWQLVSFWIGVGLTVLLIINLIVDHQGFLDFLDVADFIPLRGIISAGAMTSLALFVLSTSDMAMPLVIGLSIVLGLIMGYITVKSTKFVQNQDTGNISEQALIGLEGEVVVRIPAGGKGQVKLTYKGNSDVWISTSDSEEEIPVGSRVWVSGVPEMSTLEVRVN